LLRTYTVNGNTDYRVLCRFILFIHHLKAATTTAATGAVPVIFYLRAQVNDEN